ncbi:MAG: hypothetical protein MI975_14195 [Cytophagales bacterium]|nr:hypothetical protein [Cytophagales bacterium]
MPGAKNYDLLRNVEPWINGLDHSDTKLLQKLWIKHFCPNLAESPDKGLPLLNEYVNKIDRLSPGPHSSMGYLSNLASEITSFNE